MSDTHGSEAYGCCVPALTRFTTLPLCGSPPILNAERLVTVNGMHGAAP